MPRETFKLALLAICFTVFSLHVQARPELVAKGELVYDGATNLTWNRCSLGTKWNDEKKYCIGIKGVFHIDELEKMKMGEGWRIPTVVELQTLLRKPSAGGLYIDTTVFSDVAEFPEDYYWTSTRSGFFTWKTISFAKGSLVDHPMGSSLPVRLVRTGR